MFRPIVLLIGICGVCAVPVHAAAQEAFDQDPPALTVRMTAPAGADWQPTVRVSPATRGRVLPVLYVSLLGLQAYDGFSTSRGLEDGAIESNPLMGSLVRHPVALWAAKGGAAFVSIYVAERLWRQHRRGQAIALMIVSNGLMTAVATSNRSVLRARR